MSVVSVVCCQVEVSVSGGSLVQRTPAECGVSECDRETSTVRRPCSTRACCVMGRGGGPQMFVVRKGREIY
jgi:hypothetical protein